MFVYVTDCGTDDYFRSYKQILKASGLRCIKKEEAAMRQPLHIIKYFCQIPNAF